MQQKNESISKQISSEWCIYVRICVCICTQSTCTALFTHACLYYLCSHSQTGTSFSFFLMEAFSTYKQRTKKCVRTTVCMYIYIYICGQMGPKCTKPGQTAFVSIHVCGCAHTTQANVCVSQYVCMHVCRGMHTI